MPLHSILIASFNRLDYLKNTIISCLSSSDPDFEILIADDASDDPNTDSFFSELSKLDSRIRILRNGTNKGVGYRFYQLHQCAQGRVLHVIGSDDLLHPHRLKQAYLDLKTYELKNAIWCSPSIQLDYKYRRIGVPINRYTPFQLKATLLFQPLIQHPTVSYFNLNESGFVNYNKTYRAALDYRFYVDNFFSSVFHQSRLPLTYLVHSSQGITRSSSSRKQQLTNHDHVQFDLWNKFTDVSFDEICALRTIFVTSEHSNSSLSLPQMKHTAVGVIEKLNFAITSENKGMSQFYKICANSSDKSDYSFDEFKLRLIRILSQVKNQISNYDQQAF